MKLFLIRHGETEDNVAQLYAGTRDSELTSHGWTQATRLGEYFRSSEVRFTHVFSSTLRRAFKTAELIRSSQASLAAESMGPAPVAVARLELLMEQDFGSYEGKSFRPPKSSLHDSVQDSLDRQSEKPRFVPPESVRSMEDRMDRFLDLHLLPIFLQRHDGGDPVIAVVSHGIILAVLWRRFARRLAPGSITIAAELSNHPQGAQNNINHWSNTGYLELEITQQVARVEAALQPTDSIVGSSTPAEQTENAGDDPPRSVPDDVQSTPSAIHAFNLASCLVIIKAINGKRHLQRLKRTRGGIGSSRHDEGQQRIEMFMKRKRTE